MPTIMVGKRGRPRGETQGASDAVARVIAFRKSNNLSETELARRAGLQQPTVNRLLNAENPVWTPTLTQLMHYVENPTAAVTVVTTRTPGKNALTRAVLGLWNGSREDAMRLLQLLDAIAKFR